MHFDVIVIGGGVIGANTSFELSKHGLKTLLIDKRPFASGASGTSAAMLECQIDAYRGDPFFPLAKKSAALFPSLYEEVKNLTGLDFQLEQNGILQMAMDENEAAWLQKEVGRQKSMGLKAQWIESEPLQKKFPQLTSDQFGAALFEEDGQVNGEKLTASLIKAAELKGTVIVPDAGYIEFKIDSKKVVGLKTARDSYTADLFVVAAGAWSDEILAPLGIKLGVEPRRGQLLVYDTPQPPLPVPLYTKRDGYVTPKRDGYTLVGSTVEKVGFDESVTEEAKQELIRKACEILPGFSRKNIRGMTAGLRPWTEDGLPLLGFLQNHDNIIAATGHFRNGILLSPITATLVTELALKQKTSFDLTPFSPTRFVSQQVSLREKGGLPHVN